MKIRKFILIIIFVIFHQKWQFRLDLKIWNSLEFSPPRNVENKESLLPIGPCQSSMGPFTTHSRCPRGFSKLIFSFEKSIRESSRQTLAPYHVNMVTTCGQVFKIPRPPNYKKLPVQDAQFHKEIKIQQCKRIQMWLTLDLQILISFSLQLVKYFLNTKS